MSEIYKDRGFITKYGSSPYDMIECTHIRLVKWIDYPTLSLKTMNEVFVKMTSNRDKYAFWDAYRDDSSESTPFVFSSEDCDDPIEFNVLFYLKNDGTLAGFTEFNEVQVTDTINELWIYTEFRYGSEVTDLVIKNSLDSHIYENLFNNLDHRRSLDDTYYPTKDTISSMYVDTYQRFTNFVDHLLSNSSYSMYMSRSIISSSTSNKLNLVNPYLPYTNHKIGLYMDDLVICNWNEYLYKVVSLTKYNEDGSDYVYYSGNIRVPSESGGLGLVDYDISFMSPDIIICKLTNKPTQEVILVSLSDRVIRSKYSYESFIHDSYSFRSGYIVNNNTNESLLFKDRVESTELLTKVKSSVINNKIPGQLIGVDGSFCKFKVSKLDSDIYQYSNLEGTIMSDKPNLMTLNDCCLLDQDEDSLYFYFTYNNSLVDTRGTEDKYKYLVYKVDRSDIRGRLITSLRRNKVEYESIPWIIDAYGGILFYKDENKKLKFI